MAVKIEALRLPLEIEYGGATMPRQIDRGGLRCFRKSLGLSQRQFSSLLGISRGHYSNLEALRRLPNKDVITKLLEMSSIKNYDYFNTYLKEVYALAKKKNSKQAQELKRFLEKLIEEAENEADNFLNTDIPGPQNSGPENKFEAPSEKLEANFEAKLEALNEDTEAKLEALDKNASNSEEDRIVEELLEIEAKHDEALITEDASGLEEDASKNTEEELKQIYTPEVGIQNIEALEAKQENQENIYSEAISKESLKKKESTKERKNNISNSLNSLEINLKNKSNNVKSFLEELILINILHSPEDKVYLEDLEISDIEPENRNLFKAIKESDDLSLFNIYRLLPKEEGLELVKNFSFYPKQSVKDLYKSYIKVLIDSKVKKEVLDLIQRDSFNLENLSEIVTKYQIPEEDQEARIDRIIERLSNEMFNNANILPTSMQELNDMLGGGFKESQYVIIAARPSVGKTTLALNYLLDFAKMGKEIVFFSLEQSEMEILHRMACILAGKKLSTIDEMREYLAELSKYNIYIYSGSYSVSKIENILKTKHPNVDAVIIDYFQLIQTPNKFGSLVQEYSFVSNALKRIAKELKTTLIVASQLNREVEKRESNAPKLSDLRETGALEQDSDVVILLSNLSEPTQEKTKLRIHVAKNRNGATGFFYATFYKPAFKITSGI